MTEERITEIETPDGRTRTHTTVITEKPRSGISGWFVMFIVLAAVLVALWVFSQMSNAEAVKDNAVAKAANSVGEAAGQVGNAADRVADKVAGSE